MKIVTVLGARPQFIKAAAFSRVIRRHPEFEEIIVHTGQHYDAQMSDVFFEEMQIPKPHYQLGVISKLHGEMTGRMLVEIEKVLMNEAPDAVLVYGDTNSTLAGALAASKLHIPIAHVEAGLRSFNRRMPEEINRVLTDHLSQWLFAPTQAAVDNLRKEGIDMGRVHWSGDIMFDALLHYGNIAEERSTIIHDLGLERNQFIMATIHRAENTDDKERLNEIFDRLESISRTRTIVLPLHPRTRARLARNYSSSTFKIIEPIGYFDMITLQKHCRLIITDSGGVQKEAFFNHKYCITVREETEWVELVNNSYNVLSAPASIEKMANTLWDKSFNENGIALYGNGSTATNILNTLLTNH